MGLLEMQQRLASARAAHQDALAQLRAAHDHDAPEGAIDRGVAGLDAATATLREALGALYTGWCRMDLWSCAYCSEPVPVVDDDDKLLDRVACDFCGETNLVMNDGAPDGGGDRLVEMEDD